MNDVEKQTIYEVVSVLKELLKDNLVKIILYGSHARGDNNPFSDIDIFVLVRNPKSELNKILNIISDKIFELDLKYNVTINPLIENVKVFNQYKESYLLFENIEQDGIVLYD